MKKNLFLLVLFHLLLLVPAEGYDLKGIQPLSPYGVFSTFSAASFPKGKSGMSFGFERSRQPDYYRYTGQFGHGILDNLELDITLSYVSDWGSSRDGFEDLAIGIKHRFIDEGKYGPSVAYLVSGSFYSGRDPFSTHGRIGGGIILSKRVGPVMGHMNFLYFLPGTNRFDDDLSLAAGLDFSAAHNLTLLAEFITKKSHDGTFDRIETRVGCRFRSADTLFTDLGIGFDLKNRSPEYRFLIKFTYLFPREEKQIQRIYEKEE